MTDKKTNKRDAIIDWEKQVQEHWSKERLFEVDAPTPDKSSSKEPIDASSPPPVSTGDQKTRGKWFGTFPFPYMNGNLHLGHAFSISKVEFVCGFERMLGKVAMFPLGFHCTGMAIKAAADKLKREMELFGEDFLGYAETPNPTANGQSDHDARPSVTSASTAAKSKKSKVATKSGGLKYQFQIMQALRIPQDEIKNFVDPVRWMKYFPPIAQRDLETFGARIDWRRSFVTTDLNPYYDSFVRWQMNELKARGKIKFGKRYTVFSPKDNQPCMDHDRSTGEGVGVRELIAVKFKVLDWSPSISDDIKQAVQGKDTYLVAAADDHECWYAKTNLSVLDDMEYGIFQVNQREAFVMTERAAQNMACQNIFETGSMVLQLATLKGRHLVGSQLQPNEHLGILPGVFAIAAIGPKANQGTGIHCSTRSSSSGPNLYPRCDTPRPASVRDNPTGVLESRQLMRGEETLPDGKTTTRSKGHDRHTAVDQGRNDKPDQHFRMNAKELVEAGVAFPYAEPEERVVSRSGDECVVALCDQWYIDYGEDDWKATAKILLKRMNTYSPELMHSFEAVLEWLKQWSCAHSYCLGSRLPWDPQFFVESLSDSTIYMAYYTVSHLLQGGSMYGDKLGPLGIAPDQMTDPVWRYVLQDGPFPENQAICKDKAAQLKHSFQFFYPMDLRSSGKDLIPNHLAFCIYNHAALFKEKHWPKSMRANGHLMLDGQKMSKSTGNFLTLSEALEKFGADATRLTLADAGDDMTDANFEEKAANAYILRLHNSIAWAQEMKFAREGGRLRSGEWTQHDRAFKSEMDSLNRKAQQGFIATMYKEALKYGYFEYQSARDWYRDVTLPENGGDGMHVDLVFYFLRTSALVSQPFIPHHCEYIWREILGEQSSVQNALWPAVEEVGTVELARLHYLRDVLSNMRSTEGAMLKKKGKGKMITYDPSKARCARVFVATRYPAWKEDVLAALQECFDGGSLDEKSLRTMLDANGMIKDKRVMPFISLIKRTLGTGSLSVFSESSFSETEALQSLLPYIKSSMKLQDVSIVSVEQALRHLDGESAVADGWNRAIAEKAEPESPGIVFWNCGPGGK